MDDKNTLLAITNIVVGVLIIALCMPLRKGKVRMNCWYGIRFRKSFESDEHWYKINSYGANRLIVWSIVIIGIGILTFFIPLGAGGILRLAPLILIIPVIESWIFAKKL